MCMIWLQSSDKKLNYCGLLYICLANAQLDIPLRALERPRGVAKTFKVDLNPFRKTWVEFRKHLIQLNGDWRVKNL